MGRKTIYLLIGPKGSGKTFIGTLFDQAFGIKFLRVEDWAKSVKRERAIDDASYVKEVFQAIEAGVNQALLKYSAIVFESTGLSDEFDQMLNHLQKKYRVVLIKVKASPNLCLKRVRTRDQSIHINVSDDQVSKINELVLQKSMQTDFVIENDNKSKSALIEEIKAILDDPTAIH